MNIEPEDTSNHEGTDALLTRLSELARDRFDAGHGNVYAPLIVVDDDGEVFWNVMPVQATKKKESDDEA